MVGLIFLTALGGLTSVERLDAQDGGVWMELGAARAFPPSGTDAVQASYAMFGLRAERWTAAGSGLWAGAFGGSALDAGASNYGSADVGGRVWQSLSRRLDLGVGSEVYGFTVSAPFAYRAVTGTADAHLRARLGRVQLLLNGEGGIGRSVIEVRQRDIDRLIRNGISRTDQVQNPEAVRRAEQDLWHYGGGPEIRVLGVRRVAALSGNVFESANGTYRQATASVAGYMGSGTDASWRVVVSAWDTPGGTEVTGGLALSVPLRGLWSLRVNGLRTEPNPLVRTRGGRHGGVALRWKAIGVRPSRRSVYAISRAGVRSVAEFKVELSDASAVEVVGDFSHWEPVPMEREDDEWSVHVPVEPGVYHFGFIVDGEWYLPDTGIPGRVSDEWGRDNGTLVVPDDGDGEQR